MKTILSKSKKIIRFWAIEIGLNLLFLFFIIPLLLSSNYVVIIGIATILIMAIVVFKVVVFCMNIFLFLEIKKKYDLLVMEGNRGNRGEFEILHSLKNHLLIISIFEWLFPIVSLVFKVIYWNKIREIPSEEN